MKQSIKIINFFLLALMVFVSCKEDDDLFQQLGDDPRNLTEIISETSELSAFNAVLQQSGLDSMLRSTTTYTVFAPDNDAIAASDMSSLTGDALRNAVLNHIRSTVTADFSPTLTTGYIESMAWGPTDSNLSFYINNESDFMFNGVANLVDGQYDIGATNGVLHTVNHVLLPPTVVDQAKGNPDYTMFAEAVEKAGLEEQLSEAGSYTVFMPNNAAFEKLMMQLNGTFNWTSLDEVPLETLKEVILYHVVPEDNIISDLFQGETIATIQGESFVLNTADIDDATYENSNIILTNLQGVNGINHGVDKVLLPDTVFQDILSASLNLAERCDDKGYTAFLAAVNKAGLLNTISTEELSVFAPNNDAFELFFIGIENYSALDDFKTEEDIEVLKQLLQYHLHNGVLMASELKDGDEVETLYNDLLTVEVVGDEVKLIPSFEEGQKGVVQNANIGATNGVIHEINRVLIPKELSHALGVAGAGGLLPVADNAMVYFDFNGNGFDSWWGDIPAPNVINDAATSADGTAYFDTQNTQGTGWTGLFFRNAGDNFTPAAIGTNIDHYQFMFDINVKKPATGVIKFRFQGTGGDVFYDWDISQQEESGWVTVVIPANVLGVSDFSQVDGEFGAAYSGDSILDFSIDNVRFEELSSSLEPVSDDALVYFDFNGNGFDSWWGDTGDDAIVDDAATSADATPYFNTANDQGTDWTGLFFRNAGDNFAPAAIGTDIDSYDFKFDINVKEIFADGVIKFRFQGAIGDVLYDWDPSDIQAGKGWQTITIPASVLGVSDFSQVDGEFGAAYSGTSTLNFSMDNVRFQKR